MTIGSKYGVGLEVAPNMERYNQTRVQILEVLYQWLGLLEIGAAFKDAEKSSRGRK